MSATETQALPAGTWSVDKVHSNVGFAVDYMAGTFTGTFSDFDAVVTGGVLRGSAKVASVQVKDPNLEAHLQSPDFFDAERNPDLTFESKSIEPPRRWRSDRWRDHDQGPHRARRDHRCGLRPDQRRVRGRALRREAGGRCRPRQVRRQLEQPPAKRRAGPLQRGHDHCGPPALEAGVARCASSASAAPSAAAPTTRRCCATPATCSRTRA